MDLKTMQFDGFGMPLRLEFLLVFLAMALVGRRLIPLENGGGQFLFQITLYST